MACDLRRAFCVARLAPCCPWPLHRLLILSSDYVLEGQNAFPPDGPQVSVISGAGGQHGAWRTRAAQEREGPGQVGLAGPASPARAAARRQRGGQADRCCLHPAGLARAGRGGAGLETRRVARVARRGRGLANCRGGSGLRYADRSGLRYQRLDSGAWARTAAISTRALARA